MPPVWSLTVGKFAAGVVKTRGKFAAGVVDTGGKFITKKPEAKNLVTLSL